MTTERAAILVLLALAIFQMLMLSTAFHKLDKIEQRLDMIEAYGKMSADKK